MYNCFYEGKELACSNEILFFERAQKPEPEPRALFAKPIGHFSAPNRLTCMAWLRNLAKEDSIASRASCGPRFVSRSTFFPLLFLIVWEGVVQGDTSGCSQTLYSGPM